MHLPTDRREREQLHIHICMHAPTHVHCKFVSYSVNIPPQYQTANKMSFGRSMVKLNRAELGQYFINTSYRRGYRIQLEMIVVIKKIKQSI